MRIIRYFILVILLGMPLSPMLPTAHGVSFLDLGAGARATGLGGAFVGLADDVTATYWNPAGLAQMQRPALNLLNRVRTSDTDYLSLTAALPSRNLGTVALGFNYYGVENIDMYNERGDALGELTDDEGSVALAYAFNVGWLALGASARYSYQRLADDALVTETGGWEMAASALFHVNNRVQIGAKFADHLTLKDLDDSDVYEVDMPLTITTGLHWGEDWTDSFATHLVADVSQTEDYPLFLNLGAEIVISDMFALRAGVRDIPLERRDANIEYGDLVSSMVKPVVGLGIQRGSEDGRTLHLDYALSLEQLGFRSFVSLGYQF